jgi:hypothetical protein
MTERSLATVWAASAMAAAILVSSPATAAPPVTAEEALAKYQDSFETSAGIDCRRDTESEEIVVCGRSGRPDPNRVPFPNEREPGATVRLLPGEPSSSVAAMSAGAGMNCSASNNPRCNGGLDLFRVAGVLGKVVKELTGGND